eukprot:1176137-Prorocentrum_minimum.AAC.1
MPRPVLPFGPTKKVLGANEKGTRGGIFFAAPASWGPTKKVLGAHEEAVLWHRRASVVSR